jgi:HlyD family secretion protein
MAMDVKRDPAVLRKKKIRQAIFAGLGIVVIIGISVAVSRLKPAAPSVPANTLWFGVVKRGSMTREVRGAGTLTPLEIRWIPATTAGRVEKIVLRPGAHVVPGTVLLELSNPDLEQTVSAAEGAWASSKAQLANQQASLRSQRLTQQSNVANADSQCKIAQSTLDANKELATQGLVSQLTVKQMQAQLDQANNGLDLAKQQLAIAIENEKSQTAPQEADVNAKKALFDLARRQLDDLKVKSNMNGVLQLVSVEEGQQVAQGANLVRVADPTKLKAEVRISETQTKDLAIGQSAEIDTRSGIVHGHVIRIDPAAQGGTVGVDVSLEDALPPGARPDLSVDGTIQLQRLDNILYVDRPSFGQENSSISVFKDLGNGEAVRIAIELGVASVNTIEVKKGLNVGDKIVLSDMSQYDAYERVRLN